MSYPNKTKPELQYKILSLEIVLSEVSCQIFESTTVFQLQLPASDALYEHIKPLRFEQQALKSIEKNTYIAIWLLTLLLRVSTAGNFLTMNLTADSRFLSIR